VAVEVDLTGKVAVVTGAASGLGAAVSAALSRCGASVWVLDLHEEPAARVAAKLSTGGVQCRSRALDVGDPAAVAAAVADVRRVSGHIDVLVNNAAVDATVPIEQLGAEQAERVVRTNLLGPMYMVGQVYPHMLAANSGYIVNVLSTAARRVWTEAAVYAATKHGLRAYTDTLFKEAQRDCMQRHGSVGVGVTGLMPGGMETPFIRERFPDTPRELLQDPAEVAEAILYVLSVWPRSVVAELAILPPRETSW
jgi:NAD(P)-dependent dehydrogenase (short-subunit alcohol dehydrogenase family)